jgi:hypothetical protein
MEVQVAKKTIHILGGNSRISTDDTKLQGPDKGERIIYRNDVIQKTEKSGQHEHMWYEVRQSPDGKIHTNDSSTLRNDRKK